MEFAHLAAKRPRVDCSEGPTRQEGNAEHAEKLNPALNLAIGRHDHATMCGESRRGIPGHLPWSTEYHGLQKHLG